jgi:uncharacterized protein
MILETIISTQDAAGTPHVTPFGIKYEGQGEDMHVVISPYKPSTTLDNILATKCAVMNLTDDVRVFAGALTNRKVGELVPANKIKACRLVDCLAHVELELIEMRDDAMRPQLIMQKVAEFNHKPFAGFNRAQAAVIELAVLVSRLHILPKDKIMNEIDYLKIAIDKTAGEREIEAWRWLREKVDAYIASEKSA